MKFLLMSPGHGDVLLAEGDREIAEEEELLVQEFRRQLERGMWAAVPVEAPDGRREATMVRDFSEVPRGADQVIFFPPAAGGGTVGLDAERRALELLRATAGPDVHDMYVELGFVAVPGRGEDDRYGYLIYPQRPIVAYDAAAGEPLSEYCVRFRDQDQRSRLPDADDVLAKWIALRGDERVVIERSNMDRPGRQLDPAMVRRDLRALREWRPQGMPGRAAMDEPR